MFFRLGLASVAIAQLLFEPMMETHVGIEDMAEAFTGNFTGSTDILNPTICDDSVKQHAGYIPFKGQGGDKRFFFWLFESRSNPSKDPLVLWLTGGPGCSSMLALLFENGPCKVIEGGKTEKNPHSWNNKANVIWVDQPAGTGFSEGAAVGDEAGVAEDMYAFLQAFYKALPQYKTNAFFITGESYAGHYIPAISHRVWKGGKAKEGFAIPLTGIAIGNGLTDPEEQYKWYPQMGEDGGKSAGGSLEKGVISGITLQFMKAAVTPCVNAIHACNGGSAADCSKALLTCNYGELVPYQLTGYNVYDMRIKCAVPPLCYDIKKETAYMNDKAVQQAIGVNKEWESCNHMVNVRFQGDWMKNFQQQLPDLLHDNIRVLIYAGDVDYICNWLGNKKWALQLGYNGHDEFVKAEDKPYEVNGKAAGRLRTAKGFSFLQVYQAGHMVPLDQPEAAVQMLNQFIAGPFDKEEFHKEHEIFA
eukprot:GEMP01031405.1.p1 GENE.GEMP01031405.1~~GEMP01031405.1.p1  ORF type:complete len:474 (-),score=126.58 GEMP01031405.1:694-2115(-)